MSMNSSLHSIIILLASLSISISAFDMIDNINTSSKRDLQVAGQADNVNCNQQNNCFDCSGKSWGLCSWSDGKCSSSGKRSLNDMWYEGYANCKDDLNLCQTTSQNTTFFEMTMEPLNQAPDIITPSNYFCTYNIDLETLDEEASWMIEVWRTHSLLSTEDIEIVMKSAFETNYNDAYLRTSSYRYGETNMTSKAKLNVKN